MADLKRDDIPVCPYCGWQDEDRGEGDYVTYWGNEDGPVARECQSCGKEFSQEEKVSRRYECLTMTEVLNGA